MMLVQSLFRRHVIGRQYVSKATTTTTTTTSRQQRRNNPIHQQHQPQQQTKRYKSVLVTGGSVGIGEAICRRLSKDGYDVTIADINVEAGETLANELSSSNSSGSNNNNKATFIKTDVTVPSDVESAVKFVVETHGTLDALVNNAGIVSSQVLLADYDIDEWKNLLDINLNGVFYGMKYGIQQMCKQQEEGTGGSIVNMSSTAGFRGMANISPYTASKWAVRGITRSAAVEYGHLNIRVNAVAPTTIDTPMVKAFIDSADDPETVTDFITALNVLKGFPQPTDVASPVAFLLSDDAKYITGTTLPIDAGAISRFANAPERHTI